MNDWKLLDLTPKLVEVTAHLSLKPDADDVTRAREIWPDASDVDAAELLNAAYDAINHAATSATGKTGRVIGRSSAFGLAAPEVRVRLLSGAPFVAVR